LLHVDVVREVPEAAKPRTIKIGTTVETVQPQVTEQKEEREIIAYLLAKNQKTFTAASDGGHARTLLSRGIVIILARDGQLLDPENVPMTIPDHLWDVLQKHKDEFPYKPPDETDGAPWRVHWMERI
jgi:hypothetical protein